MKKALTIIACIAAAAALGVGGWWAFAPQKVTGDTTTAKTKKNAEIGFVVFMKNFCADKDYQLNHIKFPLGQLTNLKDASGEGYNGWFTKDFWMYPELEDFTATGKFTMVSPSKVIYKREAWEKAHGTVMEFTLNGSTWTLTSATLEPFGRYTVKSLLKASEKARKKFENKRKNSTFEEFVLSGTPGTYPELSEKVISAEDVKLKSAKEKKQMVNEIYARHGHAFPDKATKKLFMSQPWYAPLFNIEDSSLSEVELANIELLNK